VESAIKIGYGILAALMIAAAATVLLVVLAGLGVIQALVLLAILDLVIVVVGWRLTRRASASKT
jgi:membrane protein implicated in regulation of membrane protease activity